MKKLIAISSILCSIISSCTGSSASAQTQSPNEEVRTIQAAEPQTPAFLKAGDKIAVIAPAYALNGDAVSKGVEVLRSWGFVPVMGKNVGKTDNGMGGSSSAHYSATAQQRAEDLKWAFEDESIKAIICTRGGYGAIHLLDSIPASTYINNPKWLVGYSDITTIHSALTLAGIPSIHGNMVGAYGKGATPDAASIKVKDILMGKLPSYTVNPSQYNIKGHAEGTLTGGNFITFEALGGSKYDSLEKEGGVILFIEEVEESYHAIDRMFNTLLVQGKMKNIKGIIFGQFTACGRDLPYPSVEAMLYQYTKKLGIPVCCGFQGGHGSPNNPVIMGAKVILDVTDKGASISFSLE